MAQNRRPLHPVDRGCGVGLYLAGLAMIRSTTTTRTSRTGKECLEGSCDTEIQFRAMKAVFPGRGAANRYWSASFCRFERRF
jgi:hypothetical protein